MEKSERDLFKAERVRLRRTQKDVEDKSGIGQGLISRIEIDPGYAPTVAVFKKAVTGIDMTLSTFYARIEGLRTAEPPAQDAPDGPRHPVPAPSTHDEIGPEARERLTELWLALGAIVAPPRRPATLEQPAPGDRARVARRPESGDPIRRASSG